MTEARPNILFVMTDEERYPPPYEADALAEFRRTQLPARARLRAQSREFHRHYAGATACTPSRTTLFTGQYASLHGVTNTAGLAKAATDPAMHFLDPDMVPTMGDWFRAAGYRTHYRGKWHVSHPDLDVPGTHEGLRVNDADGVVDPVAVDAYRRADRLDPFGFSGWIGREPHGPLKADTGFVRDGVFAQEVVDLFGDIASADDDRSWLAVASFVNPHDIAFSGFAWDALGFPDISDSIPDIPEAPSQSDSFAYRPDCQREFHDVWPKALYPQDTDMTYRRLYHFLQTLVDAAIMRILDELHARQLDENTIIVFTSDHGDLLGAHGGLLQKWHNAFDEATRVPLLVSGPGIDPAAEGVDIATSHVDLIPTLLGLAGVDVARTADEVARHHIETQPLPGRDLSGLLLGSTPADALDAPIYFMTEDEVSAGLNRKNMFTKEPFEPVGEPGKVESVIARVAIGADADVELWKLNHYYERLPEWEESVGIAANPFASAPAAPQWELHNLTADPEERENRAGDGDAAPVFSRLQTLLERTRDEMRRTPQHVNPTG